MSFVVQLLTGLSSASSLFLTAAGLTVIFGVTRVVNFSHGSHVQHRERFDAAAQRLGHAVEARREAADFIVTLDRQPHREIAAGNAESSALNRLLVVVENYPQLKSMESFTSLMDEIAGTENRIAVARGRYNDGVRIFNTSVRSFPMNVLAGFFKFSEAPGYPVPEAAKAAPKVDFSSLKPGAGATK